MSGSSDSQNGPNVGKCLDGSRSLGKNASLMSKSTARLLQADRRATETQITTHYSQGRASLEVQHVKPCSIWTSQQQTTPGVTSVG